MIHVQKTIHLYKNHCSLISIGLGAITLVLIDVIFLSPKKPDGDVIHACITAVLNV